MDSLNKVLLSDIKEDSSERDLLNEKKLYFQQKINDLESDRKLKQSYAGKFYILLVAQLALMNLIFIAFGLGWLLFDKWSLNLFVGGTLLEIFAVVLVITKNLFPKQTV